MRAGGAGRRPARNDCSASPRRLRASAPDRRHCHQAGHAFRLDRDRLFDMLGDDVDLMQGLFSGVLRSRVAQPAELP